MILKVWDYNNVKDKTHAATFKVNCHDICFGSIMLFIYEPFQPSHQEDDAAGSLCGEFEPDLWRKNVA